ncbi:hypothetical protein DIS24_g9476 [Lasiodiplodia hormozganensis]|uniref:Aspergillopepsin-2 n=1 Tax=Lasiodiplodia hormozganensis TaxID=869390 RepID=A0AA40CJ59_9PEZI|nr:hypothetical protein DIS24_g9476 [Lasiodiplodia hormozganensis]
MKVVNPLPGGIVMLLGIFLIGFTLVTPSKVNAVKINHDLAAALGNATRTFIVTPTANNDKWGGAVFKQPPSGHFTAIQGSFTVPKISVPVDAPSQNGVNWEAAVQVGFGGTVGNDNNYWIQAGVLLSIQPSGIATYRAFHVWHPKSDPVFDDVELTIHEGDAITLRVESYSATDGVAIVENHTTGTGVHKILTAPPGAPPLLGQHAEWFISEPIDNKLTDFGNVTFTEAIAYTSDDKNFGPGEGGALVATISDDGRPMTETIVRGHELTIAYLPYIQEEHRISEKRAADPNRPGGSAGATFYQPFAGDYKAIEGTFIVPRPSLPAHDTNEDLNYTAAVAVSIGGSVQEKDSLAAVGVKLIINSRGDQAIWYKPFWTWGNTDYSFDNDFSVSEGDVLAVRLELDNATSGRASIKNNGNINSGSGKKEAMATIPRNPSTDLPVQGFNAGWTVTDRYEGDLPAPFPDFGTVDFTHAAVETVNGTKVGPGDAEGDYLTAQLIYSPEGVAMAAVVLDTNLVGITYKPLSKDQAHVE